MTARAGRFVPYRRGDHELAPLARAELRRRIAETSWHRAAAALESSVTTLEKAISGSPLQTSTRERLTTALVGGGGAR